MEHHISFSFSGRYFTIGDKATALQVWFVLHGYGQLAEFFIRKFRVLEQRRIYVVAPEGLSRFYLEDINQRVQSRNNRVGATWMTREDRLTDIRNYIAFLNGIYSKEVNDATKVTVLGFSQGAATASRWVTEGSIEFDRLILWGGILPPDLDLSQGTNILRNKETIFVKGSEDPFMNDSRFAEMNQLSSKLQIAPRIVNYSGGHDIDEGTLLGMG
jgi:predicted esterase